ncbi:S24 family peptidase [Sulfurimonas sp.]|uniref:LexA family transcriptional regulator n=1 Tax=Sulfurimonas sp. TaxID=2022749 RepID=UPI0025EBD1E4|nr:S24 family peptidase [Sulfurimonas sp.]
MESIKDILTRLCLYYGVSNNRKLSEKIDINYNTVSTWIKRNTIPYDKLHNIVQNESISFDWLLLGKGEMMLNNNTSYKADIVSEPTLKYNKQNISDNLVEITYYDNIVASAGGGAFNDDEAHTLMAFDKEFLKVHLGLTSFNNIHIITATGDSMEPTISASELLFISPIENEGGYIKEGGIYIIQCDDSILVKRVSKNNFSKEITLISDNTIYPSQTIKLDDFNTCNILGRVIGQFNGL